MGQGGLISAIVPSTTSANVVIENVTCDSAVYVKAAVYMDMAGKAWNALADSLTTSNILGIVESKQSSTTCNVRVLGVSGELFTGLDTTREYFLSDTVAGEISTTIPTDSGHIVLRVGQPFSATKFLVLKGQGTVRA